MTNYEKLKNAIEIILPACKELDTDLLTHAFTICIDAYGDSNNMTCKQKSAIALEILRNLEMQRQNV